MTAQAPNFQQLLTFLQVLQSGSVSAAARSLFVGQPAVSMQIKALEEDLGVKLFDRVGKKMVLTSAGEIVRRYAFQLSELRDALLMDIEVSEVQRRSLLRIGILDGIPKLLVLHMAQHLLQPGLDVHLQLTEGKGKYLMSELHSHQLDMVLLNYSPESSELSGVEARRVATFSVGLFAHNDFIYEKKRGVNATLKKWPLILPTYHSRIRAELDRYFVENDIEVTARVEVEDTGLQKLLCSKGLGVAVLPNMPVLGSGGTEYQLKFLDHVPGIKESVWLISQPDLKEKPVGGRIASCDFSMKKTAPM